VLNLARFTRRFATFNIAANTELPIQAGNLERGVKAQKRVATPTLIGLGAFQQEAMIAGSTQRTHCSGGIVMLICPSCKEATRVNIKREDGKKVRVCKHCGADID